MDRGRERGREGGREEGLSASELPAQGSIHGQWPNILSTTSPDPECCHNKSACVFLPSSLKPRR